MLTADKATALASQGTAEAALAQPGAAHNRIGAVLIVLSLVSAFGLLYAAFFSDRGQVSHAPQAAAAAAMATTPVMQPMASGLPEAALFLRHRPFDGDETTLVR